MNQQLDIEDVTSDFSLDRTAVRALADQLVTCAGDMEGDFCFATIGAGPVQHYTVPNGVGAVAEILALVERIGAEPNTNVYFANALFNTGSIVGNKGRTEKNVVGVLGAICDFDGKHDPANRRDRLPLEPDAEVESSAGNFQCHYWFDRPRRGDEVKPVLEALAASSGADGCKSVEHLWRMPGTFNWPTKSKINAGRSPTPYPARWTQAPDIWNRLSLETLRQAIVGKYPSAFDIARKASKPSSVSGEPVDAASLREAAGYLDCNAKYNEGWSKHVAGIGSANCQEAREIAHEWSEGKLDRHGRYKDAPPSEYLKENGGPEAVDRVLDTMPPKEGGVGVGTIEHDAQAAGWKGTLAPRKAKNPAETYKDYFSAHPLKEEPAQQQAHLLRSFMGEEISTIVPPRWLANKVLPIPAAGIFFGKRAAFKTGAGVGALTATLTGTKMFGEFECEQGDAVLVAGEGLSGLRRRIEAHAASQGLAMANFRLLVVAQVPRIGGDEEWDALVATIEARGLQNLKLIVMDHLSIMLGGADQNDATVGTVAMQRLQWLSARFNCTVIVLAHAGKEDDREVRGSSAFLDNVDFAYELKRLNDSDIVKLRCAKMRDAEAPEPFHLRADITHGAPVMFYAGKDEARRAAGQPVGLRRTEVAATLKVMGACPGGVNEWTGEVGGIGTKTLATEIARLRHEAVGDGQEATEAEVGKLVTNLNRDGATTKEFAVFVVDDSRRGRRWALAPDMISRENGHV